MPGPCLPTELWDLIMGHLADDADALRAAALVCRAWERPSRRELFATLAVDGSDVCARLGALFDGAPHLPPLVRALVLQERWGGASTGKQYDHWLGGRAHLAALLARCDRVRELQIADTALGDELHVCADALPLLERLVLGRNLWMMSDRGLPEFLRQVGRGVRDVEIAESDVGPILAALVNGEVRLQTLRVSRAIVAPSTTIQDLGGVLNVENIEMTVHQLADIALLNSLLLGAPSVKNVHCSLHPAAQPSRRGFVLPSIPTAQAPGLEHLEITACLGDLGEQFSKAVSSVRALLGKLRAPALRRLTLHFDARGVACPAPSAWAGLDSALAKFQAGHPSLTGVLVDITSGADSTFDASKAFPRLDEKGLLQVQMRP